MRLYINRWYGNNGAVMAIANTPDEAEQLLSIYESRKDGASYFAENKPARWDVETNNVFGLER